MLSALIVLAAVSVPAEVYENMLFVEAAVRGKPLRMLVDTAVPRTMFDPRFGIADGEAVELDVGGQPFRVPRAGVIDLAFFETTEGLRLDGILGMDLFQRFVVELDYDAGLVRLHDAGSWCYSGNADIVPVAIKGSRPFIEAKLKMPGREELTREYLVDSGSGGALADELFEPTAEPVGPDLGRAEHVTIGRFRFEGANGTTGAMKIGGELLKRFNVIADFSRNRMILEPSRHFADALLFDTSGLEFDNAFRIAEVYPRTPGAEAGLRKGDVIVQVDGQPAARLGLNRLRLMFHQVREHELTIRRGDEEMKVTLKLRKLL
jgi:PDZ domain